MSLDYGFLISLIENNCLYQLEEIDEDTRISTEYSSHKLIPKQLPPELEFSSVEDRLKDEIAQVNWKLDKKEYQRYKRAFNEYSDKKQLKTTEIIPLMKYFYHEKDLEGYFGMQYLCQNDYTYRYLYYLIMFYFTESSCIKGIIVEFLKKSNFNILEYSYLWLFDEIDEIVMALYPNYKDLLKIFMKPSHQNLMVNEIMARILMKYKNIDMSYCCSFYLVRKEFRFVNLLGKCDVSLEDLYLADRGRLKN